MEPIFEYLYAPTKEDLLQEELDLAGYARTKLGWINLLIVLAIVSVIMFFSLGWPFFLAFVCLVWPVAGLIAFVSFRLKHRVKKHIDHEYAKGRIFSTQVRFYKDRVEALSEFGDTRFPYKLLEKIILLDNKIIIKFNATAFVAIKDEESPAGLTDFLLSIKEEHGL